MTEQVTISCPNCGYEVQQEMEDAHFGDFNVKNKAGGWVKARSSGTNRCEECKGEFAWRLDLKIICYTSALNWQHHEA